MEINDIFRTVGIITCWAIAILVGLIVVSTIGGALVAFASTGVGAIVLIIIGYKIYKDHYKK